MDGLLLAARVERGRLRVLVLCRMGNPSLARRPDSQQLAARSVASLLVLERS